MKTLSTAKKAKFDKILDSGGVVSQVGKITQEENVEIKSYSIKKKTKLGKFTVTI